MADPIQAMLDAGLLASTRFPASSRYAGVQLDTLEAGGDVAPVRYLRRRLVPRPDRFAELYEVTAISGDRRDNLGARHAGAAELWWRLADANGVIDPRELTERPGRRIRVTLEPGVPGPADD